MQESSDRISPLEFRKKTSYTPKNIIHRYIVRVMLLNLVEIYKYEKPTNIDM